VNRRLALLVAGLLVVPLLGGCGSQSYCDAVKSHQADLGQIAQGGGHDALLRALPVFEDLQGKAPSDVADDWQLLVTRITALQTALANAHVDPAASYDPARPPAGVTAGQRTQIRRAAAGVAAADSQQALADLQQESLDVCHTPLEL
jgi:hypothetical protein